MPTSSPESHYCRGVTLRPYPVALCSLCTDTGDAPQESPGETPCASCGGSGWVTGWCENMPTGPEDCPACTPSPSATPSIPDAATETGWAVQRSLGESTPASGATPSASETERDLTDALVRVWAELESRESREVIVAARARILALAERAERAFRALKVARFEIGRLVNEGGTYHEAMDAIDAALEKRNAD